VHAAGDETTARERERDPVESLVRPVTAALVAAFGFERGREAAAEALLWACEHQARVSELENPVAYLFRVGQRRTRSRPARSVVDYSEQHRDHEFEPGLPAALKALTAHQRTAVLLVHGCRFTYREVGELMGWRRATTQRHVERGMAKLPAALGVEP
jgi:DNA-directed RNA polymerase specialized sigma24 family protein